MIISLTRIRSRAVKGELSKRCETVTVLGPVVSNDPGTVSSPSLKSHRYSTRTGPFTWTGELKVIAGPYPGVPQADRSIDLWMLRIVICNGWHSTCVCAVADTAGFGELISIHRYTGPLAVTSTLWETFLVSGSPSAKVSVSVGP